MLAKLNFPNTASSVMTSTVPSLYLLPPFAPPNLIFSSGVNVSSPKNPPGFTTRFILGYSSEIISTAPSRTIYNAGSSTLSPSTKISLSNLYVTSSIRAVRSSYSKSSRSVSRSRGTERSNLRSRDRRMASSRDPTTRLKCEVLMERITVRSSAMAVSMYLGGPSSSPRKPPPFPPPSESKSGASPCEIAEVPHACPGPITFTPFLDELLN
mmetsp:Transcript_12325/g.18302  ORF Transcript_12325/g.18302 Transcript_12325/m.18302 type:complete len:211 (-) Transcript_12325:1557-2189(-)